MNKCKYCGEPIPDSHYCCKSCFDDFEDYDDEEETEFEEGDEE